MDIDRCRSIAARIDCCKSGCRSNDDGVKVTVEKAAKRTVMETVNASGKVYPEVEVKISPDVSGEITELNVARRRQRKKRPGAGAYLCRYLHRSATKLLRG